MTVFRRWLAGELDDENQLGIVIPKQPKPLRVMPADCGNPHCSCNQNENEAESR